MADAYGRQLVEAFAGASRRATGQLIRAADATGAYAAGDAIANTTTGANATPITFSNAARIPGGSGRITGCRAVVAPASGNLVISNFAFDLLLFRPESNIPFAAGSFTADNAAMSISAAAFRQLVGIFSFSATGWRSPAGSTSVAGVAGYQSVALNSDRPYAPFDFSDLETARDLIGVLQAQAAWNPGNIQQQLDFVLDVEAN